MALRFVKGKIIKKIDDIWLEMDSKNRALLESSTQSLVNEPLDSLIPPASVAKVLFDTVARKIDTAEDPERIALLGNLQKKELWSKLDKMPQDSKVLALLQSDNNDLVQAAKSTLKSWGIEQPEKTDQDQP